MTRNVQVYDVTSSKLFVPNNIIKFPTNERRKENFHDEGLCIEVLALFNTYMDMQAKQQDVATKEEMVYCKLQEKLLLLDNYDIHKVFSEDRMKHLGEIEKTHELEKFIQLVKIWLSSEESLENTESTEKVEKLHL